MKISIHSGVNIFVDFFEINIDENLQYIIHKNVKKFMFEDQVGVYLSNYECLDS